MNYYVFQDKAPYVARALKKKEEYEITLKAYTKKQVNTHFLMLTLACSTVLVLIILFIVIN